MSHGRKFTGLAASALTSPPLQLGEVVSEFGRQRLDTLGMIERGRRRYPLEPLSQRCRLPSHAESEEAEPERRHARPVEEGRHPCEGGAHKERGSQ